MEKIKSLALKYIFSDRHFYIKLVTIALPMVIQNFIASSLNMVDTIMIGLVGESQIAAVGIANQFFLLVILLIIGIHSGGGVFIAQFWGKGDRTNIRKVLGLGLVVSCAITLLLTLVGLLYPQGIISIFNEDPLVISEGSKYLRIVSISYIFTAVSFGYGMASRSIGNAIIPMIASAIGLLCNTLLNYIFIFGHLGIPAMGVEGAALATVIARLLEMILIIIFVYTRMDILAVCFRDLTGITKKFCLNVFKTVIPVVLNEECWALGFVVCSIAYGRIGTQAIAAVQICSTIQNLFTVAIFGMAGAAGVMVGHKIGEGNEEEGQAYAWRFSILSWIGGIIIGGALALSAPAILSFFKVSDEVYQSSLRILYITSLIMVARVFCIVQIVGVLRGGGDARFAFIAEGITMWCIGVPLAFIGAFVLHLPVHGVVALVMVEEIAKSSAVLVRLVSRKWIRNVVQGLEAFEG